MSEKLLPSCYESRLKKQEIKLRIECANNGEAKKKNKSPNIEKQSPKNMKEAGKGHMKNQKLGEDCSENKNNVNEKLGVLKCSKTDLKCIKNIRQSPNPKRNVSPSPSNLPVQ